VFIATKQEINKIMGKQIYFGEVLGKHSEIVCDLDRDDLTLVTGDPKIVKLFEEHNLESGYNPLDYYDEKMEQKMKRTFDVYDGEATVSIEDTQELRDKVFKTVLNFFVAHECFHSEGIYQSDIPQIEAPGLLANLAGKVFKFNIEWKEIMKNEKNI